MSKTISGKLGASLGKAQEQLEIATKEFKLSISNFEKAQERMTVAEQSYNTAKAALNSEMSTVRESTKVTPISSR